MYNRSVDSIPRAPNPQLKACMKLRFCVCMHACMYAWLLGSWLYVCMYACMYVCMRVCVYVCMRICAYMCTCVCVYACMCVCLYAHMCLYVYMCMCVCACACMGGWLCLYVCMYIYTTIINIQQSGKPEVGTPFLVLCRIFKVPVGVICIPGALGMDPQLLPESAMAVATLSRHSWYN